jgi:polyisoprenyl-teichoic acid--peptidoglycan teichoic acid transferase
MRNRRSGDDAPVPRRSSLSGLRALGDQIDGRARTGTGGLAALGEAVDRSRRGGAGDGPDAGRGGAGSGGGGGGGRDGRAGGGRSRRRWSTRRKVLTPLVALMILGLLGAGAAYGYVRYRYDQINKVTVSAEHKAASGQPFNMLVIGSDSRVGAKAGTGIGTTTTVGGQRSDVVMIWHVVPSTRKITILSIPRDTLAQMVGKNVTSFGRFNRINASYNSGPNLLVQTIQDDFGIPINHVVQVDFAGFKGAVNALGGVHMDFRYPAKDAYSGLNITQTGCQLLNGTEALAVARSRHYQYEVNGQWTYTGVSDLGRIKRQDAFLKALVDAAKSKYDPLQLNAFLGSLPQGIAIDRTFSLGDLVGLAEDFHSITPNTISTYTLPTTTVGAVTPWGDVLFVTQPADQQMLVKIFGNELMKPTSPPPDTTLQPETPPDVSAAAASGSQSSGNGAAPSSTPTFDPTAC